MKRSSNKIGTVFLVSMLALAGLGASYAGFSDIITVYGEVETGTVEIEITEYSGTWVYKYLPTGDVVITHIPNEYSGNPDYLLVAWSEAMADPQGTYDVKMEWNNIFPCIDFMADIKVHYLGSIPGFVSVNNLEWDAGFVQFIPYVTWQYYDSDGNVITEFPIQMHYCDTIHIIVTIHLPQDDDLQGQHGEFWFDINAIQWYDCYVPPGGNGDEYQYETAFGGNTAGGGDAWWYYYHNGGTAQNIYAGQSILVGTIFVDYDNPDPDTGEVYVTITLTGGWEFCAVCPENIKIQGYDVIPGVRPNAGSFENKFTGSGSSWSGWVIGGDPTYPYWCVHLDVQLPL